MNKKEQKHIAILLGAGFSVPAGLPSANTLSEKIKATIYDCVRKSFKEGENSIFESYILEKVLIDYDCSINNFDYELYYDYLIKETKNKLDEDRLMSFIERGMYGYFWKQSRGSGIETKQHSEQIKKMINSISIEEYTDYVKGKIDWYQEVIAKNILRNTNNGKIETFNPCYQGFVDILTNYVNQDYIVDIYTLNHDLFLESLLSQTCMKDKVSNGFGDNIKHLNKIDYKTFSINNYNKPIRIYKLHGSIDIHELSYSGNTDIDYIQIVNGYIDKNAFIMDNTQFASINPLFLTGKTSKQNQYSKEPYIALLNECSNKLGIAEKLVVIGYSGNDEGINEIIFNQFRNWNNAFVISPNAKAHEFVTKNGAKALNKGIELLNLNDIKNI